MAGKSGRQPFAPTVEQRRHVEGMSAIGIPQVDIAKIIGVSINTLRKHFKPQLVAADLRANTNVAGNLYRQAIKDDFKAIPAAIFWCKTRLGWRETSAFEHSGPNGAPIQHMDLSNVSDDDLDLLEQIATRAAKAGSAGGDKG